LPPTGLLSIFAGNLVPPIERCVSVIPVGTMVKHLPQPPEGEVFASDHIQYLEPLKMRFEPGVSFPTGDRAVMRSLENAAPDGDIDALCEGLQATPHRAVGQLLGHYSGLYGDDPRRAAYFEAIGRAGQERLERWESWEAWEDATRIRPKHIDTRWSYEDDGNVRWLLARRAAIFADIERWQLLLQINLECNCGLRVCFFAPRDDAGLLDLSQLRVQASD
jgi:hypothetical protein